MKLIEKETNGNHKAHAVALFNNEIVQDTIFELFGSMYLRETKIEITTDSKDFILSELEKVIKCLDSKILKIDLNSSGF